MFKVVNQTKSKPINSEDRILIIGDIHEPFSIKGYLEFCIELKEKYNCNKIIFIGDIIDNHYSSYHETDPSALNADDELELAINKIQSWYEAFPEAIVILGNHDRLATRKIKTGGLSKKWLKNYNEIFNTPNWLYTDHIIINDILFIHGENGTARNVAKSKNLSVVQGHLHSQAYIEYINNHKFAMQIGTGIDDTKYAFDYNKHGKESILSCGIIIDKQPILYKFNK